MSINQDKLGFESNIASQPKDTIKNDKTVEFSKKILAALQDKVKSHNSQNNKKVNINQVKKVYRNTPSDKNFNQLALARVNMFLRMVSGISTYIGSNINLSKAINNKYIIEASFNPSMEDVNKADEDINNFNLNDFEFTSIEELYLDDEEDSVIYGLDTNMI
jgi:hypothetical protein